MCTIHALIRKMSLSFSKCVTFWPQKLFDNLTDSCSESHSKPEETWWGYKYGFNHWSAIISIFRPFDLEMILKWPFTKVNFHEALEYHVTCLVWPYQIKKSQIYMIFKTFHFVFWIFFPIFFKTHHFDPSGISLQLLTLQILV